MNKSILLLVLLLHFATSTAGPYHKCVDYIFPLPNSKMLPPKTTVIVRPQQEFKQSIQSLHEFIKLSGENGEVSGTVFHAADDRTIIFKPDSPLTRGETISVSISTSQFDSTDFHFSFCVANNESEPQTALSQDDDTPVQTQHVANDIRTIAGVAVPSDFPDLETHEYTTGATGKIFFATRNAKPGYGTYLVICHKDGTPYFYRKIDDRYGIDNFDLQPNGHLTCFLNQPRHHIVMDSQYALIDTIKAGHGYVTDNHELMMLENEHSLLIAEETLWFDLSDSLEGGQEKVKVLGNHVQELDAEKNVIFEWRCWDHFNITDAITGNLKAQYIDHVHMNSIAVDFDDNLILSSRHLSEITKINRNTGEIIWRMGGKHNQFTFVDDAEPASCQHDVRPVTGAPNEYTIFDNGNQKNPRYSSAVQIKINPDEKTVGQVWDYHYSPQRFIKGKGAVQRLDNGNSFIDWTDNPPVMVSEVNPAGDLIYECYAQGVSTYRSRVHEWYGVAPQPYFIIENFGSTVHLIFNKFGDEQVKAYNIYHAIDGQEFELITTTTESFFVLDNPQNHTTHFFYVTAVYDDGRESDESNRQRLYVDYVTPGDNMIKNGSFASDEFWTLMTQNEALAIGSVDSIGQYHISITAQGEELTDIQLAQDSLTLIKDREYRLQFDAYAEHNRAVQPILTSLNNPSLDYAAIGNLALSKRLQHFSFNFTMQHISATASRLVFNCGQYTGDIFLDNISLQQVIIPSSVENSEEKIFISLSNYPNPFNESTIIHFHLHRAQNIRLHVFNLKGQLVTTVIDGFREKGDHYTRFSVNDYASGVYFYRLSTMEKSIHKKFIIMR